MAFMWVGWIPVVVFGIVWWAFLRYYQREEAVERNFERRIEVALQGRDLEAGVRLEVENGKVRVPVI